MRVQVEEAKKIFVETNEEEYERIQDLRRNDDFIVDDDGYGYRDHGGEIWEQDYEEEEDGAKKKKKRKVDVSIIQGLSHLCLAERIANHKLYDARKYSWKKERTVRDNNKAPSRKAKGH